MNKEINGFVIYNQNNTNKAFGIVSENYECKAKSIKIPEKLKEYIVPLEDKRFFEHKGVDYRGIARALIRNFQNMKVLEGGSTISQQLARNLLNENSKTINRKIRETFKALEIEKSHTKDQILDLYFENVYFGKNIRGIRSASLSYFDKEPERLTHSEILFLITILRGPNYYLSNLDKANKRLKLLSKLLYENQNINFNQLTKLNRRNIKIFSNKIIPIRNSSIPFIAKNIDYNTKTIISTLTDFHQKFADNFVRESKYPTSVIIIKNEKVVGFSSYYGSDYPFIFKSNVGSTLKPFIYYLAKKKGITNQRKFNSYSNNLNWKVREATYVKPQLHIDDALFYSNNNSFINISDEIGIDNTLEFLSKTLRTTSNELFPSTILGATKNGISLYELALTYNKFLSQDIDEEKQQLLKILNKIFKSKVKINIEDAFLKTGTTNDNTERLAIVQHADETYAFLRNENPENDSSKDGDIFKQLKRTFTNFFKPPKEYKWM